MIRAGIHGATGYTGHELASILDRHPAVEIAFGTSRQSAGRNLADLYTQGPDLPLIDPSSAPVGEIDFMFLCLPHTEAAPVAVAALDAGARVVDLSADFRLRQAAEFEAWYGEAHPHPEFLSQAVYGLTEIARAQLAGARLVANPGCYPTSVLLALFPLARAGALSGSVIVDAKSGVSGAGRSPKQHLQFVEVAENLSAYSVGRNHRHVPEMEQALAAWTTQPIDLIFTPHLAPVSRGLLSTIYASLREGWDEARVRETIESTYQGEPFIRILPDGQHAALAHAAYTNRCVLGISVVKGVALLTSALDNLVKGAAGQAVQNANVMAGLDETTGLV
jgi:N-acetyl-gamma-glutamyl-phosphate reductase